jgi:uncharacterized protein (DUF1330 family)
MPAYCLANIDIHSPEIYEDYRRHTLATIEAYGGKFVARGGAVRAVEGDWKPRRVVMLEFPSMQALETWYHSAEYQAIVGARQAGARTDLLFIDGLAAAADSPAVSTTSA